MLIFIPLPLHFSDKEAAFLTASWWLGLLGEGTLKFA